MLAVSLVLTILIYVLSVYLNDIGNGNVLLKASAYFCDCIVVVYKK